MRKVVIILTILLTFFILTEAHGQAVVSHPVEKSVRSVADQDPLENLSSKTSSSNQNPVSKSVDHNLVEQTKSMSEWMVNVIWKILGDEPKPIDEKLIRDDV